VRSADLSKTGENMKQPIVFCVLAALGMGLVFAFRPSPDGDGDRDGGPSFTPRPALTLSATSPFASTIIRVGLDPEALAAAGVTSGQVAGVIQAVLASDAAVSGDLAAADADHREARGEVDRLTRLVRSGTGSAEDVTALAAARSNLATAEAAQAAAMNALCSAGVAGLSGSVQTALATIRASRGTKLPVEYLAVSGTRDDWLSLHRALQHEKVAAKTGEALAEEIATQLATFRARSAVATARANLDARLAAVHTAWEDALTE